MRRVLVIGAGIAGTAAALVANRGGATVVVLSAAGGATALAPGALDDEPWETRRGPAVVLDEEARAVIEALDAYALPEGGAELATTAGIVRPARGHDRALLDLGPLSGRAILVPRLERGSWDGASLARAWNDSRSAQATGLRFVHAQANLTRFLDEHAAADADIAARHDEAARLAWLAERLKDAIGRHPEPVGAVVLPPWLGVESARALELSAQVGVPCGEALSGPGGPAGLRFEHARDRALARARITAAWAHVVAVRHEADGFRVEVEEKTPDVGVVDAVVLATGGLIGGGLRYTPAGWVLAAEVPSAARPLVECSLEAPVVIGAGGATLSHPASLFGAPPESHAWPFARAPVLDRIGVLTDDDGRVIGGPPGLFAAGELVADRPRTWLSGLVAAARTGKVAATG